MRNLYSYRKLKEIADIAHLGIELNDVNEGNFIYDKNGNNILIDSGHAQFNSCFRPMVVGKHISLQNLSGREI